MPTINKFIGLAYAILVFIIHYTSLITISYIAGPQFLLLSAAFFQLIHTGKLFAVTKQTGVNKVFFSVHSVNIYEGPAIFVNLGSRWR
jgi:hypothetical protein